MKTSDVISEFILKLLDEADGSLDLKRNELAQHFNVVPSQINYVITSRFSPEHGYRIESHRGGGGFIRIIRINSDKSLGTMHAINSIGSTLTMTEASILLRNLESYGFISKRDAGLIFSAVSDNVLSVPPPVRDSLRAAIVKSMLIEVCK